MKNEIVKKHNDLIQKARYSLSEVEIKIVSNLISMIRTDDTEFQQYHIDINQLQKLTNTNIKDNSYYIDIAKALMSKPFAIDNKVFNWVTYAEHEENSSILKFEIHRNLKPYLLELQKNFTQYNITNIMMLKSGYVIRLYELIILEYKQYMKYNTKAKSYTFDLEIDYIRELFEIPQSYRYNDIKRLIDKAQKQFKDRTNIKFDYEEYKIGRAVKRLKITVRENNKGSNDFLRDEKAFIAYMRKNFVNKDILTARDKDTQEIYTLSVSEKGILYDKRGKHFDAKRSKEMWSKIYELAKEDKLLCLKQGVLF